MGKRFLVLVGAFVTPGGLLALILAWFMTRPDVQVRIEELWMRLVHKAERQPSAAAIVLHEVTVLDVPPSARSVARPVVHVPVSRSRCHRTVTFTALHAV